MNPSTPKPRQSRLRDGEWEWLNRPGRFRVGGVLGKPEASGGRRSQTTDQG